MVTRSNVKLGLTGALFAILIGALGACADIPTAPSDEGEKCVLIDGKIFCS